MGNSLKKYINTYMNIICQNEFYGNTIDIPRPTKMKKPENYFGSTGRNAREYDLYIQDEAQAVFQDKYGREKGHNAWWGIISVGNAMWKACDEILGERRSMQADVRDWLEKHPEIEQSEQERGKYCHGGFYSGSYIVIWTWWILTQIIDGKRFTHDYISGCIPTFKGVLQKAPIITKALLDAAGIDVQNYTLSKKVQAKVDAAKAKAEEEKRIADEKAAAEQKRNKDRQQIINEFIQACNELNIKCPEIKPQYFNEEGGVDSYRYLGYATRAISMIFKGWVDPNVGIKNLLQLPLPTNKDEQRIYDIIFKSKNDHKDLIGIFALNIRKADSLASIMNRKITGDAKRQARKNAALKYGLTFLADYFE